MIVTKEIAQKRYDICKTCDSFIKATTQCKECLCFMKLKVKLASAACPKEKWKRENS